MNYTFENHPEPGLATDAVKLLIMKLNRPNIWVHSVVLPASYDNDMAYIQAQLDSVSDPYTKLYLFVFLSETKPKCFLTLLLTNLLQQDFANFSFQTFLSYFDNTKQVRNDILSHYLGKQDYSHIDIETLIRKSESIPDKIKVLLLGFILDPLKYINHLKKQLTSYHTTLKKQNRTDLQATLDISTLMALIKSCTTNPDKVLSTITDPVIRYSLCTSIPNYLLMESTSSLWFIFAQNSIVSSSFHTSDFLLYFGDAIKNKNRLAILRLLHSRSPLSISDINAVIGLSPSTLLHHISILKKAHIINEDRIAKQSFYSLNLDGLIYASDILLNLAKGDSK